MAKAPRPGAQRAKTERADALRVFEVTLNGKTWRLTFPLPSGEKRALRVATGLRIEDFVATRDGRLLADSDTVSVFVWLARRQAGEVGADLASIDAEVDDVIRIVGDDPDKADKLIRIDELTEDDDDDPEG